MENNPFFTKERKYQLALFGILVISSVISVGLFAARTAPSPKGPYTSLVWNLFLAWLPLGFAWIASISTQLPKVLMHLLVGICAFFWLLFFPNALYILTDFQHIAIRDTNTPVWYDVIMLLWFSWSGLFLGAISLYLMQNVVARWLGKVFSWLFVMGATTLGSMGVYVGRFFYKNSWDIMINPRYVSGDILRFFSQTQKQALIFSFSFALFFLFVYLMLFVFGHLINAISTEKIG
jgi:uncharacterized membrane protein